MKTFTATAIIALSMTACSGIQGPDGGRVDSGAVYTYSRSPDGTVSASVSTTRDIGSASIKMDENGGLDVQIEGAQSNHQKVLEKALDRIPIPAVTP